MNKKKFVFIKDLACWLKSRFCLTESEKKVVLLILFILWAGLVARLLHLHKAAAIQTFEGTAGLQSGPIRHKVDE